MASFKEEWQLLLKGVEKEEGLNWYIQLYLDIYRVHNKINVWIIQGFIFIICLVLSLLLKRFLVKIYEKICGEYKVLNETPYPYEKESRKF